MKTQGHDQGLLFKGQDKDLSSKDKDCILVLKESLRTRTNITEDDAKRYAVIMTRDVN